MNKKYKKQETKSNIDFIQRFMDVCLSIELKIDLFDSLGQYFMKKINIMTTAMAYFSSAIIQFHIIHS